LQVRGAKAGLATAQHRSEAMTLLRAVLAGRGAQGGVTGEETAAIAESLAEPGLLDAEGPDARIIGEALVPLVRVLLDVAPPGVMSTDRVARGRVLRSLVQAMAVAGEGPAAEGAQECLPLLAESGGFVGPEGEGEQQLLAEHWDDLLDSLQEPGGGLWGKDSPRRLAFDALVRFAGVGVGKGLARLIPLFASHLKAENDPELRLVMMALLECVIAKPACANQLADHSRALIADILLPNCVWRAGRVASTIRKVALVCLYSLLKDRRVTLQALHETVPPLLPVLKTDLEDYDASSRQLVALSLDQIFQLLPRAFDEVR
jgi:hypothetical protein